MSSSNIYPGKLVEVAKITMGQSPKGEECNNIGNGLPLLNGPTEFGLTHPNPVQYTTDPKKIAKKGDLLFCVRGSTVGRMNWADQDYAIGRGLCSISPDDPENKYFIKSVIDVNLPHLLNIATGSTFPNVSKDMLLQLPIMIPPKEEQLGISNVFESLDLKIQLNYATNKNLEEMAQALFKRWFVDFQFPNENGEPYQSSGGEFEDSELGLIPKGWRVSQLEEFCDISTEGANPSLSTDVIFEHYSIPAFDDGKIPVFELGSEIKSNKYKVKKNSILVSKLNPETKRVWKPYCLTENAVCSTEFINYIPKDHGLIAFCYSVLNSELFHQFLISNTTGSTNSRQRAKPIATLSYKMAVGDRSITTLFSKTVDAIYKKSLENILLNKKLADIHDSLLPKLMLGEIRMPLEQGYDLTADLPKAAESKEQYSNT